MAKRIAFVTATVVLAWFGGRALYRALADDRTRVRWVLADEAAAFNDASLLTVLRGFAPDWRDETSGMTLDALRAGVMWSFQNRRAPGTNDFAFRVEFDPAACEVDVDPAATSATARFPLRLFDARRAGAEPAWALAVTAALARVDGEWRIVGSRHETVQGAMPR